MILANEGLQKRLAGAEKERDAWQLAYYGRDIAHNRLVKRLEEAEKDRRWLVDYAHKGPWATINDYREFDRIAASVGEKP
jgi:hypothetical protein